MDEILATGHRREGRAQLVLGSILLLGGLALVLGMGALTISTLHEASYGAIGFGVALIARGLIAATARRPARKP